MEAYIKFCPCCKTGTALHTVSCQCGHVYRTQFNPVSGQPLARPAPSPPPQAPPTLARRAALQALASCFSVVGWVVWAIGGLIGFVICIALALHEWGSLGALLGFCLGPITFLFLPLLALLKYGSWWLLILDWGSTVTFFSFLAISGTFREMAEHLTPVSSP